MVRPAVQLYTLRDIEEPLSRKLERIAETNFQGVEFAGLGGAAVADIASQLDTLGLTAVGAHVAVEELKQEYADVVATYDELGCRRIVVARYESEAFATTAGIEGAAERLSELAERLAEDGFELLYHNHTFEFEDVGGETAMDRLVERSSDLVGIEIDTGLAKHAGADPVDLLRRYGERVPLLHLTDTRSNSGSTVHAELGGGEVDLRACLDTAREVDVEWVIYEHGRTTDPIASLAHGDVTLSAMTSN